MSHGMKTTAAIAAILAARDALVDANDKLREAALDPATTRDELRAINRATREMMVEVARTEIASVELPPPVMTT